MIFEIPLSGRSEAFGITLGGTDYRLTLQYRAGWILNIADANNSPIVGGIPLVTGVDLLGQYRHLGFTGGLWVQGSANPDDVPTFSDLGTGAKLYWVSDQ